MPCGIEEFQTDLRSRSQPLVLLLDLALPVCKHNERLEDVEKVTNTFHGALYSKVGHFAFITMAPFS